MSFRPGQRNALLEGPILGSTQTSLAQTGIWLAFPVSNVLVSLLAVALFAKGDWKRGKLTPTQKLTEHVSEEILVEEGVH